MGKPNGSGDVVVIPRDGNYSRAERRAIQRKMPRGSVMMFDDEARVQYTGLDALQQKANGKIASAIIYDPDRERKIKARQTAADVILGTDFITDRVNEMAAAIYSVLRSKCMIVDTIDKIAEVAVHHWPVQGAKIMAGYQEHKYDNTHTCVITKAMWLDALYTILSIHQADSDEKCIYRYDRILQNELEEGNDTALGLLYVQVFGIMGLICDRKKHEQEAIKQQRAAEAADKRAANVKNSAKVDKLKAQLESAQREGRVRAETLQERIKTMSREFEEREEKLRQRNEQLEEELAIYRSIEEQTEQVEEIDEDTPLLDLPESNVMFVGGHPNMVSKLRAEHGGWKFASSVSEIPEPVQSDVVFYYCRHVSHKMLQKLQKWYTGPILYCEGTNMDKLHDSMRRIYTVCIAKGLGDGKFHA